MNCVSFGLQYFGHVLDDTSNNVFHGERLSRVVLDENHPCVCGGSLSFSVLVCTLSYGFAFRIVVACEMLRRDLSCGR